MTERDWIIMVSVVVMVFWCLFVGRELWLRHKKKKEAADGKKADKKQGEEKAFDDEDEE